jgi:hypothetical protein
MMVWFVCVCLYISCLLCRAFRAESRHGGRPLLTVLTNKAILYI